MSLSVLDLFTVGIGPSSSHTVGPMRAALRFATDLQRDGLLESVGRVETGLFGSLGATGRGHGSDRAVLLGLEGADPETVDIDHAYGRVEAIREEGRLRLAGEHEIAFDVDKDLILHLRQSLPGHPNGMRFTAFDAAGQEVRMREYYSVGGGFVVDADAVESDSLVADETRLPAPFTTGDELLEACRISGRSIAELMMANEEVFRPREETRAALLHIWDVMQECVDNGCSRTEELLPGGLQVRRRAPALRTSLREQEEAAKALNSDVRDPLWAMEWVNLYALAVNEENASGGRVVTAPTNGAAGIVPAVLHFYTRFVDKFVYFWVFVGDKVRTTRYCTR